MCPTCGATGDCEHRLFVVESGGRPVPVYCAAGRERGAAMLSGVLVRMVTGWSESNGMAVRFRGVPDDGRTGR